MVTTKRLRSSRGLAMVLLLALAAVSATPALAQAAQADPAAGGSYSYVRTIEGAATLLSAGPAGDDARHPGEPAEVNRPVLPGDRVRVANRGRVEIVLADRNLLRLDGGSEVVFAQVAGSPDANGTGGARLTQLRLVEGNFQLVVVQDALGDELPRVDTPNATIYVQVPGTYRVTSDQGDWSSVVVRRGSVEVVTGRGSVRVRADEEAQIEGERDARAAIAAASGYDAIERWGRDLEAQAAGDGDLDESLRYQGSALSRYGSWIEVDGQRYWRPTATGDSGWRPFTDGYWAYTPSGMTWVATEPWGWVPYHYGSWDYLPGYGWVWEPGTVFAASWVYWYWGPTYVGWCPIGFYTRWYGHRFHDPAFRFGVYGWAGGDWNLFAHWNFVGIGHFGHRNLHRWVRPGGDLSGDMRMAQLPKGLITTDTRGLTPGRWQHPDQVLNVLRHHRGGGNGRDDGDLPDVTSFVARNPQLPPQVLRTVLADGPQGGTREPLAGTPLRPGSEGRGGRNGWNGRSERPTLPSHTWDREPGAPRTTPRPDPGDRAVRPPVHTWDRPTAANPVTPVSPQGGGAERPTGRTWDRPAPTPPAPREGRPADRGWDRPSRVTPAVPERPSSPATPTTPRDSGWRDRQATPAPRGNERPERWQRQEPVPRSTPPPPAPRYNPPAAPRSTPPPAPRYTPPPAPRSAPPPAPRSMPAPAPAPRPQPAPAPAPRSQPQRPPEKPHDH